MTKNDTFWDSMRGSWLNLFSPCAAFAITLLGEKESVPEWITSLAILSIWFAGFFILIRVQFRRRNRNSDVFKSFWTTTVFGLLLFTTLLVSMYLVR